MLGKISVSASIAVWLPDRSRITCYFDILDAWYLEQQQLGSNYDCCHKYQVDAGTINWLLSPSCCSEWLHFHLQKHIVLSPSTSRSCRIQKSFFTGMQMLFRCTFLGCQKVQKGYWLCLTGFLCQFRISTCLLVYPKGNWLLPQRQTQCCMLASKLQCLGLDFCSWELDKNQN